MSYAPGDVAEYLRRIGWDGDAPRPDRTSLEALVVRHAAAIPFENLDPFSGRPAQLAPQVLLEKLVRRGRGGFCFEQNLLLQGMLDAIGFATTGLAARVLWDQPLDACPPRTHMALKIDLPGGPVIADVGFGRGVMTGVLDLVADQPQQSPLERYRLAAEEHGWWRVEIEQAGEWRPMYRFDLTPQARVDYELPCWYVSTHPQSLFTTMLVAARALPDRRMGLRGADFTLHHRDGRREHRTLADAREIGTVLSEEFGIALPHDPALAARLDTLAKG